MASTQTVAVWPSSVREVFERKETPYMLLDAKAGWLARMAWKLLKKLNALTPYMETVRRWDYVPHKQDALHNAMLQAVDHDLRYVRDGEAVFIIGGATFSELVGAPAFRDYMIFQTGPFGMSEPYHGRRMFDIPIHVVPNMTGLAVVPRVYVERNQEQR